MAPQTDSLLNPLDLLTIDAIGLKIELKKQNEKIEYYREENERLHEIIRDFKRNRFGVKSERWESEEQMVFNEAETLCLNPKPDEDDGDDETNKKTGTE